MGMTPGEVGFWLALALVAYTYGLYPVLLGLAAALSRRPPRPAGRFEGTAAVVLAARDEQETIARRARELAAQLVDSGLAGELIVVSDGSTDRTAELARAVAGPVRVIELDGHRGKSAALNEGAAAARADLLIFADARQRWAPDAMRRLADNFLDPAIGAVSGDLVIEAAPGAVAGMLVYWGYEKWIRRQEGRLHSTIGVTGSIAAVRREQFRPIPGGMILDDLYWPMQVAMNGARVVHDGTAHAYDRLPDRARDEFRRKVRTLCGNFQLLAWLPAALLPWRNPVWWQFVSHKVLRLLIPWALLAMLLTSALLRDSVYRMALTAQVAVYVVALAGLRGAVSARSRLAGAAASFVVLNTAAWVAFWVWACGGAHRAWGKVAYEHGLSETT
jgi:cellulose synthase/poly-beta-1,6-N-acetylglucosamine synthase-like glycosyltransferase